MGRRRLLSQRRFGSLVLWGSASTLRRGFFFVVTECFEFFVDGGTFVQEKLDSLVFQSVGFFSGGHWVLLDWAWREERLKGKVAIR